MIIGEYKLSNLITYLGLFLSLTSIGWIWRGQLDLAMMAFILSGICDLFDGRFANSFQRTEAEKAFGLELDSLCDVINFAALPAILIIKTIPFQWLSWPLTLIFCFSAITRLAYFNRNAKSDDGRDPYFTGVPVTYTALVFPVFYVLCQLLNPSFFSMGLPLLAMLMAFLFVWNIRIPKPNKVAYIGFFLAAILTIFILVSFLLW